MAAADLLTSQRRDLPDVSRQSPAQSQSSFVADNLTDAELHLWQRLRRKQILGVQFYRQNPIGNYIVDFYVPAVRLVVELDGSQHLERGQAEHDVRRTRDLEQQGVRVLRFDDRQALLETESVLEMIFHAVKNPS